MEEIKSCFNIDLYRAFVPFHRGKVYKSIWNMLFSGAGEPVYDRYALSRFIKASEVDVENI